MGKKITILPYMRNTREGRKMVKKHERNLSRVKKMKEYMGQAEKGFVKYSVNLEEKK